MRIVYYFAALISSRNPDTRRVSKTNISNFLPLSACIFTPKSNQTNSVGRQTFVSPRVLFTALHRSPPPVFAWLGILNDGQSEAAVVVNRRKKSGHARAQTHNNVASKHTDCCYGWNNPFYLLLGTSKREKNSGCCSSGWLLCEVERGVDLFDC